GVLYGAEDPLRVRHHDGHAAITAAQTGDTTRRTVGVGRVGFTDLAVVVDEAHRHGAGQIGLEQGFLALELSMTFTVGDGDRHPRTGHATQEDRRRLLDLHHRYARFELLRTVAHEVR